MEHQKPLEASYWNLLKTTFHRLLQKVLGWGWKVDLGLLFDKKLLIFKREVNNNKSY